MKSTTFARLALGLPYVILIESVLYFVFYDLAEKDNLLQSFNLAWNFLAIFWFVPYTILVIILLVRSRGKTFPQIKTIFQSAPLWMMLIAPATYLAILVIELLVSRDFFEGAATLLVVAMAVSIPASLILGYLFLGLSLALHNLLLKIGAVKHDGSQQTEIASQELPL